MTDRYLATPLRRALEKTIREARVVAERGAENDRPLTIFDFNVFGSTKGLESLPNVTLFDAARLEREATTFADDMCRASDFNEAVDEAEAWIVEHALSSRPGHDAEPQAVACAESARAEALGSARGRGISE